MSIADVRREYGRGDLNESDVAREPHEQFARWLEDALRAELTEPTAMTLATATADGRPSARTVLLKGHDEQGFSFFTNYESRKAVELEANPHAALLLYWPELERQIRVEGRVTRTDRTISEAYFHHRPRESRIGAWASPQSEVIPDRGYLQQRVDEYASKFEGDEIPLPPFWGGYLLVPEFVEFWQGRLGRLHDRLRYRRLETGWTIERLAP